MTTNDDGYDAAFDWHEAGRKVVAIVDTRQSPNGACVSKATDLGIDVITGSAVIDVAGAKRVTAVCVAPISADGDTVTGSVM
jgi:sarcosine oxidase subunit alpha